MEQIAARVDLPEIIILFRETRLSRVTTDDRNTYIDPDLTRQIGKKCVIMSSLFRDGFVANGKLILFSRVVFKTSGLKEIAQKEAEEKTGLPCVILPGIITSALVVNSSLYEKSDYGDDECTD